jgi:hypothetical protein
MEKIFDGFFSNLARIGHLWMLSNVIGKLEISLGSVNE